MKKFTILLGLFIFLLGVYSCKEQVTPVDDKSKIAQLVGLVSEFIKNNQVPVKDAVVSITGDGINLKDTTDNLGNYSFSVRLDTSKILLYTVTKTGYKTKVLSGTVSPGTTIIRDFEIQVDTTITIGTVSGNPHTIAYLGPQTIELSVYGVGGEESKLASYEVRDSLGNSIKSEGKDTITFSLNGIPVQGGAYVSPVYGIISPAGKAITTVNSGTISGVVQLEASIRRAADGKIIKSTPVKVIINAGLPDQSFFTISAERYNFPALNLPNKTNTISVQVGDKYSNPVQQNTAVYFNTTSGVIEGAGYTSPSGQISKTLSSGNPFPANGTAWVRAFTIGQDGISVSDSVRIIFSGKPAITVAPDSIEVTRGSFQDFTVTIIDQNGNPLASGTTVTSTIEFTKPDGTNWNAVVSGLPTESFGDHRDPGLNVTQFSMRVTDTTPEGGTPEKMPVIIKITVTGDNGKLTKVIYGTVGSKTTSGGLTGSGYPYSITYGGPTTIPLSVSGVGGVESKLVSYEVRDSVGNPISLDKKDTVVFTISGPTSMGGTHVSPVFAITDANGKATTTIYSGTVSGVFQLTAILRRDDNGVLIQSAPVKIIVRSGFPSQEHFTLSPSLQNFAAIEFGKTMIVRVQVGDKYSNPVEPGTAVYFSTTGGIITTTEAFTDANGLAQATLYNGNPSPPGGIAVVKARTLGSDGVIVQDSAFVVFSRNAMLTASTDSINVSRSSYQDIALTVADQNRNPLASGTKIISNISYTKPANVPSAAVSLSGLPTTPFGDYLTPGPNRTNYTLRVTDDTPGGLTERMPVVVTVTVEGPNGTTFKTFYGAVGTKVTSDGSGYPYSITYGGPTTIPLSVSGVGGVESKLVSYEVRDSVGNPISFDRKDTVVFIISGPTSTGGTLVSPVFAITDANGKATTTIYSGTVSGVFQLTAILRRDDNGALIQSTPVKIVVRAGLPNQEHFSLWASLYNFPALFKFGETMAIFVKLGDKYSNPVEPGTAVYFNTTGGIITGDAYTNLFGDASVLLQSANPYPVGGYACVKAQTLGEGGILIQDSIRILFSGNSSITSLTDSFRVERESYKDIPITVSDQNGNPLAAGTLITTTLEYTPPAGVPNATVIINGLPTAPFGDYLTVGPNRTNFTMRIIDATPGGTTDKMNVKITVKIEGPNGITFKNFFGTVGTKVTGGDPATAFPHSIAYVGPATINLSVAGVGGTESAIITYEVRDSLGAPITLERRDTVSFSLVGTPILGGAYVSPAYAITNAAGRVSTTINSGIKSGVLQLVATLRRESDGAIVSSTPIKVVINAGLPNQAHFSIAPSQFNFAGYDWVGIKNPILVQVGDKYSNPVQLNTAIYFNTTGGIIEAAGYTNAAGQTVNVLYSGNPKPYDPTPGFGHGYAWVKAQTLGENGVIVKDSIRVLFSSVPYINITPDSINVPKGGRQTFDVNISDQHGNPLAPGTIITPTIEFTPPTGMNWSAKIGGLPTAPLDDYLIRGPGRTDFELQVIDGTPGGTPQVMNVVVKIVVTGANGTATKFIYGSVGN